MLYIIIYISEFFCEFFPYLRYAFRPFAALLFVLACLQKVVEVFLAFYFPVAFPNLLHCLAHPPVSVWTAPPDDRPVAQAYTGWGSPAVVAVYA